jgi:N-acyl-D-amino-acid deacylase
MAMQVGQAPALDFHRYIFSSPVIEKVSGHDYEDYVRKEVLAPLGVSSMKLGKTLPEHRAKGEVKYYSPGRKKGDRHGTGAFILASYRN